MKIGIGLCSLDHTRRCLSSEKLRMLETMKTLLPQQEGITFLSHQHNILFLSVHSVLMDATG